MDSLHIFNGTQGIRLDDAGAKYLLGILLHYFDPPGVPVVRADEAEELANMIRAIMRDDQLGGVHFNFDQALQIAKLHFQLKGDIVHGQAKGD